MTGDKFEPGKDVLNHDILRDTLTPMEISSYAARGVMPDEGMSYVGWLLWYMLRDIYTEFSAGTLTKEQGAERKKQAMRIYESQCEYLCRTMAMCDRMADLWKRIEIAASAYRKERSIENADEMMRIIYGIL